MRQPPLASTAGRKAKPLPQFLLDGLAELGCRRMPDIGLVPFFRHPRHADLRVTVVVGNLPGDDSLLAEWTGQPPIRVSPDDMLARLRAQIEALESPVQKMPMSAEEQASD